MSTQTVIAKKSFAVVQGLQVLLADTYALMAQTHLAHWNVEGSNFFQLHEAFEDQYKELFEAVDEVAERLRALDKLAPSGLQTLADYSHIEEMPVKFIPAKDLVAHLVDSHEILVADAFDLRKTSEAAGDLETQDLVIGRIRAHQKTLWMLKSFLQDR